MGSINADQSFQETTLCTATTKGGAPAKAPRSFKFVEIMKLLASFRFKRRWFISCLEVVMRKAQWMLVAAVLMARPAFSAEPARITGLQVEHADNPIGI